MAERLEDTLRRLAKERDEADRRYNEALTELDRSHPRSAPLPRPHRPFDEHQLPALNESWNIIAAQPGAPGLKGRLARAVWRLIAPYFQRQLTFNSQLVDHLNRTTAAARESQRSAEDLVAALEARVAALNEFHTRLLVYLQQITAYVDTKDRETAGSGLVLNASISGLAENFDRRWESLNVRFEDLRIAIEAELERNASRFDTLKTAVAIAQQASGAVKREVDRLMADGSVAAAPAASFAQPVEEPFAAPLDSFKYVGFEECFRGPRDAIRHSFESYVAIFAGAEDVLDVGCGRGEFLELLRAAGIRASGIDVNHEMAEQCRARGLDVSTADAVGHLSRLEDASLGGLFSAQVVEHLQPGYLLRFLELAFHKLRPGSAIVLETLNPACWAAFFDSYIRDITHVCPLHPDTLKYLVLASGFAEADVQYRSPVTAAEKLQQAPVSRTGGAALADLADVFNGNVDKLNARLFTHRDYAVIGRR
jgi:O-antigen chain-terminating methyltransferase